MSTIIEKVEIFIQRLHDLDYTITPEATEIWYSDPSRPLDRKNLADHLANVISRYLREKDNEQDRFHCAQLCSLWINRAFACGVIKEGQGLARQLAECREKNIQLENDLEKLSVQYLQLQRTHEEFTKRIRLPDETDLEKDR